MNERHRLVESLLCLVREYSMTAPGETVLVAVSGGPDSVALVHALWSVREELGITLYVAHLNHSFRGEESDNDAKFVWSLASSLSIPCVIEKVDVPRMRQMLRLSAESAARLVRYEFLENTAEKIGAARIALGHTADDQVETVLMNIIRGSGTDGLAGMPPVRGKIIRPLLGVRRTDVASYLQEQGLSARIDETNLLPHFTRNRIRLRLLPMLREYNPGIDTVILQLAELARADSAYMNAEASKVFKRLTIACDTGAVTLDRGELLGLDLAIRRRVVREAVKSVRSDLSDLGFRHVEDLLGLLATGGDFRYELPAGVFVECERGSIVFRSERQPDVPIIYKYEIAVPGETPIGEAGVLIKAEVIESHLEPVRSPDDTEVILDLDKVKGTLVARNWQPGDRIQPLGMKGSKKLQDVFTDRKIPRRVRHRIPVIQDGERILWVVGVIISDVAKVTDSTQRCLRLRAVPVSPCSYDRKVV